MTFPTAGSNIYRNEDGEVLGWDSTYYDEPDYDLYSSQWDDYEPDEIAPEDCEHDDVSNIERVSEGLEHGDCDGCGSKVKIVDTDDEYGVYLR